MIRPLGTVLTSLHTNEKANGAILSSTVGLFSSGELFHAMGGVSMF